MCTPTQVPGQISNQNYPPSKLGYAPQGVVCVPVAQTSVVPVAVVSSENYGIVQKLSIPFEGDVGPESEAPSNDDTEDASIGGASDSASGAAASASSGGAAASSSGAAASAASGGAAAASSGGAAAAGSGGAAAASGGAAASAGPGGAAASAGGAAASASSGGAAASSG